MLSFISYHLHNKWEANTIFFCPILQGSKILGLLLNFLSSFIENLQGEKRGILLTSECDSHLPYI